MMYEVFMKLPATLFNLWKRDSLIDSILIAMKFFLANRHLDFTYKIILQFKFYENI